MNYCPEPGSHIRYKVEVKLYLLNCAVKKKLKDATGADSSNLGAKSDFIALKAAVDMLDVVRLTNVSTCLNNLKAKVDNLSVGKLKTILLDLKKLSDALDNKLLKTKNSTH